MRPELVRRVFAVAVALVCLGAFVFAAWSRNRDILLDLYDYSTVVAAAGKVEAGFKPYTGVRSPMQSSTYLLNYWTEQIFGRNYLALTFGGLALALGGALLIWGLLRRILGDGAAILAATAVTLAGTLQHVVIFYNPVGILCFSVVILGLAVEPELRLGRAWRTWAIVGALFLGGINKLNFHGAALVLAGLLTLGAWAGGRMAGRAVVWNALILGVGGLVAPFAFELWWTGATPAQWWADVVALPRSRHDMFGQLLDPAIYLRPVHDFHHHQLTGAMGGAGLLVLLLAGCWLGRAALVARRPVVDLVLRLLLIVSGLIMATLLMITNVETVLLTSLAYPVIALAAFVLYRRAGERANRWFGVTLIFASLFWTVTGGYAAWHGSRVLYAKDPPLRDRYVRLDTNLRALQYFQGVRLLPADIEAMTRLAKKMAMMEDEHGRLPGVLFGTALEWLERAYPEAIVPRAPIWYDAGTSLHNDDTAYFRDLLADGRRLVTHRGWQAWPDRVTEILSRDYFEEQIGSRDLIYHPKIAIAAPLVAARDGPVSAGEFRVLNGSNVLLAATRYSGDMRMHPSGRGDIFGSPGDSSWHWPKGAHDATGVAVVTLAPEAIRGGRVTFRIFAGDFDFREMLWEMPVQVSPERREVSVSFVLQPGGRELWFQTQADQAETGLLTSGWRELRITHAGALDQTPALPFDGRLEQLGGAAAEGYVTYGRRSNDLGLDGTGIVPSEHWRRYDTPVTHVEIATEFVANAADAGDPVVVTLAWYRAGRFEIMTEQMIDLRQINRVTLMATPPEAIGWVGLLTRPAGGEGAGHRMMITRWDIR